MARRFLIAVLGVLIIVNAAVAQPGPPAPIPPVMQQPGQQPGQQPFGPDGRPVSEQGTKAGEAKAPAKERNRRNIFSSDTGKRCRTQGMIICDLPAAQATGNPCECRMGPGSMRAGVVIP